MSKLHVIPRVSATARERDYMVDGRIQWAAAAVSPVVLVAWLAADLTDVIEAFDD